VINLKAINSFFQNKIQFEASYFDLSQIQEQTNSTEIAFFGRSNVGKSSLINKIAMQSDLAFTSKKPGCTISLNFYFIRNEDASKKLYLVDLPGYGYAKRSGKDIKKATNLINNYILKRHELKKIYLLIDSSIGIQKADAETISFLNSNNINFRIVLTKIDKLKDNQVIELKRLLESFFAPYQNVDKDILTISAKNNNGLDQLRFEIMRDFNS
jgi:GTP-binding protein